MKTPLFARALSALLLADMGMPVNAQEDEQKDDNERRVRIEITRNENGKTSHVSREFDLDNDQELHDALREMGVLDELNVIGNGENMVLELRRMNEGGLLNDMSMALTMPDAMEGIDELEPKAFLGVSYETYAPTKDKKRKDAPPVKEGALLTHVEEGSPADDAGLQKGDVIVDMSGRRITEGEELADAVTDREPGDRVKVTYYRGKQKKTVETVLGARSFVAKAWGRNDDAEEGSNWIYQGSDADWESYYGDGAAAMDDRPFLGVLGGPTEDDDNGVRIGEVVEGSTAEHIGVQEDDIIRRVNDTEVKDFGALSEIISGMKPGDAVKLDIRRAGKDLTLSGQLGKRAERTQSWNNIRFAPVAPTPPTPPIAPGAPVPPMAVAPLRGRLHLQGSGQGGELREELDELREEMGRLRRELRGEITRETRITINTIELSPEEKQVLQGKGVKGFDQPLELNDLRCFPNPSEGSFHLQFQVPERGDLNVDVHDATGERIYHETITGFKGNYDRVLDLSDRAAGTYFVVIAQNGHIQSRKMVRK